MTRFFTTLPPGAYVDWEPDWYTPEIAHSDELPFCEKPHCWCHFEPVRVEKYLVGPIERGELDIPAALDRYYCRQLVAGRR